MERYECCCCFQEDVSFNNVVACPSGHVTCTTCMERALQVAVGERQLLTCLICSSLHPERVECNLLYDELAINRSTQDFKLKQAYDVVVAQKLLYNTEIPDSYSCPFCDNTVVLEADVSQFPRFKCNGCQRISCRQCRTDAHDGSCDPLRRHEEDETETFLVTCFCGSRFYRGDGCNKVICVNCRKRWCWLCKASLGANAWQHFRTTHDTQDDERCNLYGERSAGQRFAPLPARLPVVRKKVDVDREQAPRTSTIEFPCLDDASSSSNSNLSLQSGNTRCAARLKTANRPCPYKAKQDGFCLRHPQSST